VPEHKGQKQIQNSSFLLLIISKLYFINGHFLGQIHSFFPSFLLPLPSGLKTPVLYEIFY